MAKLCARGIDAICNRMVRISEDASPLWGKMSRDQMFGHLRDTINYSMGLGPDVPFRGNFKTKYVFAPLILNGIKRIPQNIRAPRVKGAPDHGTRTGTTEDVQAALVQFLAECDGKPLPHHPFFGHIGFTGWRKFHVVHCDHHLRQFGV